MYRYRTPILLLFACSIAFTWRAAESMPILMDQYNDHPQSLRAYRDECVICHVNADGSGALSPFGERYNRAQLQLTPELVGQYPNLFSVDGNPEAGTAAGGDNGAPSPGAPVPGNEPFEVRAYYLAECVNCHGKYGDGDPFQGVPAFATAQWVEERSSQTDELLQILLHGKDKMIGHAGKITEDDARELIDLVIVIAKKYS